MRRAGGAAALVLAPGVAQAECLGQGCYDGLFSMLVMTLLYLAIGITLLVLMIRRKWRVWRWLLGGTLVVALGIPAVSQAVLAWKVWTMERREIAGTPPPLAERTPLLVVLEGYCNYNACAEFLEQSGSILMFDAAAPDALEGLDLTRPLDLSTLPVMLWTRAENPGDADASRPATAEELAAIDYILLVRQPWYRTVSSPLDQALRANPALRSARANETVKLGMAPLPASGQLDLAALQFDALDLWLTDSAHIFPFIPGIVFGPDDDFAGTEAVINSVCRGADGPSWECSEEFR